MPCARVALELGNELARVRGEPGAVRRAARDTRDVGDSRRASAGLMEEASRTTGASAPRSRAAEILLFAANFLRHPEMLGSIIPSSRFLVNAVTRSIDWSRARVIVEYGPGVGTFTQEILRQMRSDARLIVIETNLDFVKFLGESFPDKRLRIEHDSAANVQRILRRHALPGADYIVSGIPLGSMPRSL